MIRAELHDSDCRYCGESLKEAAYVGREDVTYTRGEFAGESGVALIALCGCGMTSVVPLSVDLRRAA